MSIEVSEHEQKPTHSPMRRGDALMRLIGGTPMIPIYFEVERRTVWCKCEFLNPSGSVKDRLARTIILDGERTGQLRSESIILECTSGNTGIALSMLGAARGYGVTIVMSERASGERRKMIEHFGAKLILFSESGYHAGIQITQRMAQENPDYFLPRQFENPINAMDHEHETGQEILAQVDGPIDAFVSGYGTGGTLAGCSRALKQRRAATRIIAMEPAESALLAGEEACCHWIEGISGGFVPPLLEGVSIDAVAKVSSQEAIDMTLRLNREQGLLVGSSSGANVAAALREACALGPDAIVVTLLCDRAERYFSTRLFDSRC